MSLPKIENYPVKSETLPVSQAKVRYRPFLVKEQKVFLMAKASKSIMDVFDTVEQVVGNCCVGGDPIDVGEIPLVDLEFLFLRMRALSKGQISDISYICKNVVDLKEGDERIDEDIKLPPGKKRCRTRVKISIDLLKIEPTISENHTNNVPIEGTPFVMVFAYPTLNMMRSIFKESNEGKSLTPDGFGIEMIEYLLTGVFNTEDETFSTPESREELKEFIEQLSEDDLEKIEKNFVETMPKLFHEFTFVCPSCGHTEEIKLEGLQSFF